MDEKSLLNQVFQEIERLERETRLLQTEAQKQLETHWTLCQEPVYSLFDTYRKALAASEFATYSIQQSTLKKMENLCTNSQNFPTEFSLRERDEKPDLSKLEKMKTQAQLAVASLDMHIDFKSNHIVVPIFMDENACGLIVAHIPNLELHHYANIALTTSGFLENLRKSVRSALSAHQTTPSAEAS